MGATHPLVFLSIPREAPGESRIRNSDVPGQCFPA